MYKVFIISDSYDLLTILSYLELECDENISEVMILREQHNLTECMNSKFEISYARTISEGLYSSDFCLVSNSFFDKIPKRDCEIINFNSFEVTNQSIIQNIDTKKAKIPNILIISFGKYTQDTSLALSIASSIKKNNGHSFFDFPNNLRELSIILKKRGLCNHKSVFIRDGHDVKISVVYIDNFYDSLQDYCLQNIMSQSIPDIIILNTNNLFDKYSKIHKLFKYKYGRNIDFIIKSRYIPFELFENITLPIFCKPANDDNYGNVYIDTWEQKYQNKLISRITLPNDIYVLNN